LVYRDDEVPSSFASFIHQNLDMPDLSCLITDGSVSGRRQSLTVPSDITPLIDLLAERVKFRRVKFG
jgi:hypothetical protein